MCNTIFFLNYFNQSSDFKLNRLDEPTTYVDQNFIYLTIEIISKTYLLGKYLKNQYNNMFIVYKLYIVGITVT